MEIATLGEKNYTYAAECWGYLPQGTEWGQMPCVALDSMGRVYVSHREDHRVMIFDPQGKFQSAWGQEILKDPHGIVISPRDEAYIVDRNAHQVMKFDIEGNLLWTLGNKDQPSDTGYGPQNRKVMQAGPPFNRPTDVAVAPSGEIYVSDGYGNCRVHRFSPQGELIQSWGQPGSGRGEFNMPHSVWVDKEGRVLVADRENHRIQIFTPDGDYITEWGGFLQPTDIWADSSDTVYISELGNRVSILTGSGELLARFGSSGNRPGEFYGAHGIWGDSQGNLYVTEVLKGRRVQKFIKKI